MARKMSEFEKRCNEFRENKRLMEELKAENDRIQQRILELMAGREEMISGAAKATYKTVTTRRFDSVSFKEQYPDVYEQYSTETISKRFLVK